MPAQLGVGFRRPAFGPYWDFRGRGRLLWLLLRVAGLHRWWMWTSDAERRSNGPAIHVGAYVKRSLVAVLLRNRSLLLLLLRWSVGMVDHGVLPGLAVVTPARLARGTVVGGEGRAVNIADVSRCSWTRQAAARPSLRMCLHTSRLDVRAYATHDAIRRHRPSMERRCLRGACRKPLSGRFTSVCRRF